MSKEFYLYRHIRLDNNEPFYIGIGTSNTKATSIKKYYSRAYEKARRNPFWKNIINKSEYKVDILFISDSRETILEKEIEFIKLYGRKTSILGSLCNLTDGGEGVLNQIVSQQTRDKISKTLTGTKASDETKSKLSLLRMGSGNTFYNKIHSLDSLEKMKINHPFRKEVIQYDTKGNIINQFNSVGEAAQLTGFDKSHIIANCNKKKSSFLVGGFIFRYKNDIFEYVPYIPYNLKRVSQFTKTGEFVQSFNSIKDAGLFLNLKRWAAISDCCNGKLKTAYGFIWKTE